MPGASELEPIARNFLQRAAAQGLVLRVCGGFAVWLRASDGRAIASRTARTYSDLDFVAYSAQHRQLQAFLRAEGFVEDAATATVPGLGRIIFANQKLNLHGDVFLDRLVFTHTIDFLGRLERDQATLPLAELLLQKLQIGRFNEKDAVDVAMLVHDHAFTSDASGFETDRLKAVFGADWGLCQTCADNIARTRDFIGQAYGGGDPVTRRVSAQLDALTALMNATPKTLSWRLRALPGRLVNWRNAVDDL